MTCSWNKLKKFAPAMKAMKGIREAVYLCEYGVYRKERTQTETVTKHSAINSKRKANTWNIEIHIIHIDD